MDTQKEGVDPRIFQWVRQRLDGASFAWIAERADLPQQEIVDAWEECRLLLTLHLVGVDETPMGDDEIFSRSEECIRLLLHWQEVSHSEARLLKFEQADI